MTHSTLVTGAAGFIGSHVVERLLAAGHQVTGLDSFDPFYARAIKERNLDGARTHPACELVEGDIADLDRVTELLRRRGVDGVIHLAALAGVTPSLGRALDYARVNVAGTQAVMEAARRAGVARLVLASSSSVYGARSAIPFHEDDPCDTPASPYAATKRAMEILAYAHHAIHGVPVRCLRFFTVYGPRQRPEMAIAHFARRIARGEPITLYGDGSSARDYTYVDDIVTGVVASLERCDAGYRIYNLGGTRTTTLLRLVDLLEGALGLAADVRLEPDRRGDVPITCASVDRATAELGYRPTVPVEEGIRRYVSWGRETGLWG